MWGFAAWYNKRTDIYQRLTLDRWHWSALSCCLLIDPPSTDVCTQSAKQFILVVCTRCNVYIMCPQVRRPPGPNWTPTINNHFLITQSPMRIPLFTDQHLRLLDLRSRSQQLESQFIVWSGRAENLNPTLEQEINSHADATFALNRFSQMIFLWISSKSMSLAQGVPFEFRLASIFF